MSFKKRSKLDSLKYGWLRDTRSFIVLFVVMLIASYLLLGVSRVEGDSMEPNLSSGDVVFYLRVNMSYEAGDIISIRLPSGEAYVKRIIACGGDTVDIIDGSVYVNGQQLTEDYAIGITEKKTNVVSYPLTIEEGYYFVLGDNREVSVDSRNIGLIAQQQIMGKILFH